MKSWSICKANGDVVGYDTHIEEEPAGVHCKHDHTPNAATREAMAELDSPGTKFDSGKPRWDLLPFEGVNEILKVLADGASVHGDENWRRVDGAKVRYWNAAMRHLTKHKMEGVIDSEHGTSHLAHAAVNVLFLLALYDAEIKGVAK
jgi:hypothetical protein